MKVCLTANSGGHLNQILQLKSFYKNYDHFFITDRNSFSQELAKNEKVYFVEKFIFKEVFARYQFYKPIKNILQSLVVFFKERPNVIITTGAGTSLGIWILGKIFKKTIFIESIARTNGPSTFGKLIGSRSDKIFVQWESMLDFYKNSTYAGIVFNFENIKIISKSNKIKNIFLTTGTYKLQFNRLLSEIDNLIENKELHCDISAQIGASNYKPKYYTYFDYCGQNELHSHIDKADLIICQGGSGSIMDSLLKGKKVIAVPRLVKFNEFFDDHQIQLVSELEKLGLIMAVHDIKNLGTAIEKAENFNPQFQSMNQSRYNIFLQEYFNEIE